MIREEAEANVGKMVYTCDPTPKMIAVPAGTECYKGPFLLKQVTKGGVAILENYENYNFGRVKLRHIALEYGGRG